MLSVYETPVSRRSDILVLCEGKKLQYGVVFLIEFLFPDVWFAKQEELQDPWYQRLQLVTH